MNIGQQNKYRENYNSNQNMNPMMIKQQQQMYMIQNMQKQQHMQNMQRQTQNNQNLQQTQLKTSKNAENEKLVNDIKMIMQMKESDEKTELLGETLFYFLLGAISKYKLNITNGVYDDAILCSKLTGILLQAEENELLDIVENNEILVMTIRDVIMVSYTNLFF